MELRKWKASEKNDRETGIGSLKKSKIQKQCEYGGISQKSVSLRYEGLKLGPILENLSQYSFTLNHSNIRGLIKDLSAKTEKLRGAYREIGNFETYVEAPFTPHDVHRAIAAMEYQQDRLKEVQKFLVGAEAHGKGPIKALTEMSPELFRKEAPSDRWQGGGRMAIKNPLEDIAVVIRPTEVRIAEKFFEALVENIYTLDERIAEAMPVLDYGLAIYEKNPKPVQSPQAPEAPAKPVQNDPRSALKRAEMVQRAAQQHKLSEISQRDLDRNIHHIRGYLKSMHDFYSPEQVNDRRDFLLEDIFQIIKCRVAISSVQHDLDEAELREVFKQSIFSGLEVFESKFSGGVAFEKIRTLIDRAQTEELTVHAKREPEHLPDDNPGPLRAYVRAMSY